MVLYGLLAERSAALPHRIRLPPWLVSLVVACWAIIVAAERQ